MTEPSPREGASAGTGKLIAVMLGSLALSAGGVVYAIGTGVATDGQRGGALAVALTFFMLFAGRGTPEEALETEPPANLAASERPAFEIARLRAALASMLDWQSQEKVYLTVSSVIGTLAWGFGDWVAAWFGAR